MCNKIRHIEDVPLSTVAISLEHTHFTQWVCLCINTSSFLLQFNEDCDLLVFEVKEASDKVVLYLHFFVISMDVLSIFLHRDASSRQFGKNMELTHLSIEDDI